MPTSSFQSLLEEAREAHQRIPAVRDFCAFADDLKPLEHEHRRIPSADLMAQDPDMRDADADPLVRAVLQASDEAFWRLTYAGTHIGQDFLDRFGCFCLIGSGGGWISAQISAYFVYMPPGLYYPWHHHPAEEIYHVLAGEAEFFRDGEAAEVLRAGDSSLHASNQPHATQTHDRGFMAYVVWRNNLTTPPVLTNREETF